MAGLGRKVFTAGDVLTASDVQNYMMDQSVMYFAGTAARSSAIATPTTGMTTYIGTTGTATIPQIETYTGSQWQTPYATTLLANVSLTATSSTNILNVFNATYDNYLVFLRTDVSTTSTVRIRMGVGGTPNSTASNYKWGGFLSAIGSSSGNFTGTLSNSWDIGEALTQLTANVTILSPFIAKSTNYISSAVGSDYYNWSYNGNMSVTTSYTDLNILCSAGTMTGNIRVYGLRNS